MNDHQSHLTDAAAAWLAGRGEMAEHIRGLDWAATPLGPTATWPQSLLHIPKPVDPAELTVVVASLTGRT